MVPITVMIKPASGRCNMRCRYCFYADEQAHRTQPDRAVMSEQTLGAVFETIFASGRGPVSILFQGGEPTCAGLGFFERAMELQRRHNRAGVPVSNAIQTNALALNEDWARFFAAHRFLVGVSLDGPRELHDQNRLDSRGEGTHARVMKAIGLLRRHRVSFSVLSVVTGPAARSARKTYHFLCKNGLLNQQFIPCLEPLGQARGSQVYSLSAQAYGQFLKDLFDCWYGDVCLGKPVYNRYFNNLLQMLQGRAPEMCGMMGQCAVQYVVEADASVYPCDFYMLDEWCLGNFLRDSVQDIDRRRAQLGFIEQSRQMARQCQGCPWFALCRGGCWRDRGPDAAGAPGPSSLCEAYRAFLPYAYPRLVQLARRL